MGDFNLNLLHYNENVHCQEFLDLMLSKYLIPLIRKPTRVTDTSSTLIDNIFSNDISFVSSGVIVSDISDHFPIYAKVPLVKSCCLKTQRFTFRDFSESNIDRLRERLLTANWEEVFGIDNDAETAFHTFLDKFSRLYDEIIPLRQSTRSTYKKTPRMPWITKSLLKSINHKNNLFCKYKRNPNENTKGNMHVIVIFLQQL